MPIVDLVPIALIDAAPPACLTTAGEDRWAVFSTEGRWTIAARGWVSLGWSLRLNRLSDLLTSLVAETETSQIEWLFSGVILTRDAASRAERLWRETGDVPALQLVRVDVGARGEKGLEGITSSGLALIVGHEIEALCKPTTRNARAILVGRLIGHCLRFGPITGSDVRDHLGQVHRIEFHARGIFGCNATIRIDDIMRD
jgi:hypothetical protein